MTSKKFLFAFFVLGFSSIVAQALIIRELMISFYGNELFSSLALGFWLVLVGIGSLLFSVIFQKINSAKILLLGHILIAIFLPLEIFFIRLIKNFFVLPGEIPNLLPVLFYTFFALSPLCLVLGAFWTIGSKLYGRFFKKISFALTRAYILETIGFIVGGLVFSLFLISFSEFLAIFLVAVLNLFSAFFLSLSLEKKSFIFRISIFVLLILFVLITFLPISTKLKYHLLSLRFKNQELQESINTKYGNLAVTRSNSQFNFFQNGLLIGSHKETYFYEGLIHLSLLHSVSPRKVLLIGHGFNGGVTEILKHPVEKIIYLELDPKLIPFAQKYLPTDLAKTLGDPRVKIIHQDARWFVKENQEKFDVIILNFGDPSSLLLNRFYTKEFFSELKRSLTPQGLLATYLTLAPNYVSKELVNLNESLYRALKENFSEVIALPEDINLFLAAEEGILTYGPEELINRFETRKIKTRFITSQWILYRLTNDRVKNVRNLLETSFDIGANSDFLPLSYLYTLFFWLKQFHPWSVRFLTNTARISHFWVLVLFILIYVFWQRRKNTDLTKILPFITAIPDFSLLGLEILFIYAFQIFYGYIYNFITTLITLVMAGMLLGNILALRKIKKAQVNTRSLVMIYLAIALLSLFFLLSLKFQKNFWLVIPFLAGILVGIEFPLANALYLTSGTEEKTGIIYGADLIGSCLGAILVPLYFIPFFGVLPTLWFLIGLNILGGTILLLQKPRR